jgi:hypothetical protein
MNGTFDANLRRTTLEAKQGTTSLQSAGYAFDYAGRLGSMLGAKKVIFHRRSEQPERRHP